jgi:hypothetical protein
MLKAFTAVITMFALFLAGLEVPTGKVRRGRGNQISRKRYRANCINSVGL